MTKYEWVYARRYRWSVTERTQFDSHLHQCPCSIDVQVSEFARLYDKSNLPRKRHFWTSTKYHVSEYTSNDELVSVKVHVVLCNIEFVVKFKWSEK